MKELLTASELTFLASQNLSAEDVFDIRYHHSSVWPRLMKEAGKTIGLGSPCRKARHRLRTRGGHCCQCDTSKLAYAARYDLHQRVYILGSVKAGLLKIGTS